MNQKYSPEMRERALRILDEAKASGERPNLKSAARHVAGLLGRRGDAAGVASPPRDWHRREARRLE